MPNNTMRRLPKKSPLCLKWWGHMYCPRPRPPVLTLLLDLSSWQSAHGKGAPYLAEIHLGSSAGLVLRTSQPISGRCRPAPPGRDEPVDGGGVHWRFYPAKTGPSGGSTGTLISAFSQRGAPAGGSASGTRFAMGRSDFRYANIASRSLLDIMP